MVLRLSPCIGASNVPFSPPPEATTDTDDADKSPQPADQPSSAAPPIAQPSSAPPPSPASVSTSSSEGPDCLLREAVSRLGAVYEGAQRWRAQREGGNTLAEALALVTVDDGIAVGGLVALTKKYAAAWPQRWVVPLVSGVFAAPDADVHWGPGTACVPTVPSVFWSNSRAFDCVARYLAAGYTYCDRRAYKRTVGLVFEATARFRAHLRARDCFVGWVDLDCGRDAAQFTASTDTLIVSARTAIPDDRYARWLVEIRANATACVGQHHCEDTRNIMIWAHDDLFCRLTIVRWFQTATLAVATKADIVNAHPWLEDRDRPIVGVNWDPVEGPPSPSLFYSEDIEGSTPSTTSSTKPQRECKPRRHVSRMSLHRSTPLPSDILRRIKEEEARREGRFADADSDSDTVARERADAVAHVPGIYPKPPSMTESERLLAASGAPTAVAAPQVVVMESGSSRAVQRRRKALALARHPPDHRPHVPCDVSCDADCESEAESVVSWHSACSAGKDASASRGRRAAVVFVTLPLASPAPLRTPLQEWPQSANNGVSPGVGSEGGEAPPTEPPSDKPKQGLKSRFSRFFRRRRTSPKEGEEDKEDENDDKEETKPPVSAATFESAATADYATSSTTVTATVTVIPAKDKLACHTLLPRSSSLKGKSRGSKGTRTAQEAKGRAKEATTKEATTKETTTKTPTADAAITDKPKSLQHFLNKPLPALPKLQGKSKRGFVVKRRHTVSTRGQKA